MARTAPTAVITPAMFRHFAVITIVITASLAIFADGENRELIEDRLEETAARNRMKQTEFANGMTNELATIKRRSNIHAETSGEEIAISGGDSDSGMEPESPNSDMASTARTSSVQRERIDEAEHTAEPPNYATSGTPSVNPALAKRRGATKPQPPKRPSQTQMDDAMAAARARSRASN